MSDKIKERLNQIKEDRRRDIIESRKMNIIREVHKLGKIAHGAFNQKDFRSLKLGTKPIASLRSLRGAGSALGSLDKLFALEASRIPAQKKLDQLMIKLNGDLLKPKNKNDTPFRSLERNEAEKIVKEASDAWKGGIMNFELGEKTDSGLTIGDSSVDAHQNGNFNRPELPGQFRPDLNLPGHLFRQE